MTTIAEGPSVSDLAEKLAAIEKKLSELEIKYSGVPQTAEALTPKGKANEKDLNAGHADEKLYQEIEEDNSDPRVKVVIIRSDPETGEPIEQASKLQTVKREDQKQRAFILRKNVFDAKFMRYQLANSSEIDIINPELWELLKEHLGHYPYHIFRDSPVTLQSPFEPIIFHFDELSSVAQQSTQDETDAQRVAREDMKRLLDVISSGDSGDEKLDKYFKMRPNYRKQVEENTIDPETIQFMDLWTAFPPGTLIFGKPFQGEDQVFVVKDNCSTWPQKLPMRNGGRTYNPWELDAWTYDWKDGNFRRIDFTLEFEEFDGHLPLTSLPYFPFELHPQHEDVRKRLIERGMKFRKICEAKEDQRLFDYGGQAISEQKGFAKHDKEGGHVADWRSSSSNDLSFLLSYTGRKPTESLIQNAKSTDVRSRVMVDYDSFFQYARDEGRNGPLEPADGGPGCMCSDCQSNEGLDKRYRLRFDMKAGDKEWEDDQYLICPPRVLGYVLANKEWAQLQVTSLSPITAGSKKDMNTQFSLLKLADDAEDNTKSNRDTRKRRDTSTKGLLLDLVRSHTTMQSGERDDETEQKNTKLEVDDIIPGKGKGLVVLLYGPPGVGKTSTAEMMAIATKKPLFSVSVADVGTEAKHVEANLSRIFALATKWHAILLIDEADVFLESRGRGSKVQSADKNALVSVFLRVLEYYHGIMFLTTNHIASFDIAIVSRIHVAIRFESLDQKQTEAIFRNFLDKLEDNRLIESYTDRDGILDWLEDTVYREGLDGRQIRNVVTTALGLARAAKEEGDGNGKLTKEHLRRAFLNVNTFKNDFKLQMQRYKDSQEKMIK
ncbi:hypothetical protein HYALB_00008138 [Hymenoscyphus albidus]|uniref:AAA+ ATPase domain-containing protein n=1 Tax=Hymenoscyphus albidus TaxID=595503 RepID=A0A9N9PR81_9HELO|nr:hypothetical protein HYALB_00008138 [Hymenoscyphus albidus]